MESPNSKSSPSLLSVSEEVLKAFEKDYLNGEETSYTHSQSNFSNLLTYLGTPPSVSCVRVNTLVTNREELSRELKSHFSELGTNFFVQPHSIVKDAVMIFSPNSENIVPVPSLEVIVDISCGAAVMRGADVFAPGVRGARSFMKCGDVVSVYLDLENKCLRGFQKKFNGKKLFIGNGISMFNRDQLFKSIENIRGLAVKLTERKYPCPSLGQCFQDKLFLQNLPSVICGLVLDPQPGEIILDMCAAPGGKTTHIAALMHNTGKIIALDKTESKVRRIKENAKRLGINCIDAYVFDSTEALRLGQCKEGGVVGAPPFSPCVFDRVLLDGPCSGLGQRPLVSHIKNVKDLLALQKLQRKLISVGVELLKFGGIFVYSTCTLLRSENEEQVSWIIRNFPFMELVQQSPRVGGPGSAGAGLSAQQCGILQRFQFVEDELCERELDLCAETSLSKPTSYNSSKNEISCNESDSIGFFIAKFKKIKPK